MRVIPRTGRAWLAVLLTALLCMPLVALPARARLVPDAPIQTSSSTGFPLSPAVVQPQGSSPVAGWRATRGATGEAAIGRARRVQVPTPRPAWAADTTWLWPLNPQPTVVRGFDPPAGPWSAGHRGVDLLGQVGDQVLSIGSGTVIFAGVVAGRGVVVVDHGAVQSTYEPVTAVVRVGDAVRAGQIIGLLQIVQSHCLPRACLHLGARDATGYIDPLSLLGGGPIVLKPTGR